MICMSNVNILQVISRWTSGRKVLSVVGGKYCMHNVIAIDFNIKSIASSSTIIMCQEEGYGQTIITDNKVVILCIIWRYC